MTERPAISEPGTTVAAFRKVSKHYGSIIAACELELEVYAGEFLSLLGPSGCGKTTSLRLIAGFEQPTLGQVLLQNQVVNQVPAYQRPVNMVFQHYALFPHLTVAENVGYGLRQRKPRPGRADITRSVDAMLELVRLDGYQARRIWELSGGQQQRVALARALINQPAILLLDEPLAALDRKLRHQMQIELQSLQRRLGITFILVTHDQEEALSMSDRVCLMRHGKIMQIGSPRDLYDRPRNRYVADFVGRTNFFEGTVERCDTSGCLIRLDSGDTVLSDNPDNVANLSPGAAVEISIRPEQLVVTRARQAPSGNTAITLEGIVQNRIFLGEHTEYLLRHDRLGDILVLSPRQSELTEAPLSTGETVYVTCGRNAALLLKRENPPETKFNESSQGEPAHAKAH